MLRSIGPLVHRLCCHCFSLSVTRRLPSRRWPISLCLISSVFSVLSHSPPCFLFALFVLFLVQGPESIPPLRQKSGLATVLIVCLPQAIT